MRGVQVQGALFRQIRLARGLTQQELAKLAGVAERTVRNAENGRRVRLEFLRYLATALGIDLKDVVRDPDELRMLLREQELAARVKVALIAMAHNRDLSEYRSLIDQHNFRIIYPETNLPISGEYRGLDGAQRLLDIAEQSIIYEEPSAVTEIRASGSFVILSGIDHLRSSVTGLTCKSWWTHIYEFVDGKLVRVDALMDTTAISAAFCP